MIGYVPQEPLLMHDSIAANVTLGDPAPDAGRMSTPRCAPRAREEFVAALPHGIETVVGERGLRLSGGQRQRIALARALVRKPALLILDEATTALDADAEAEICETFRRLRGELTILAICHQGGLIAIADRVYRVDGATIVPVAPAALRRGRNRIVSGGRSRAARRRSAGFAPKAHDATPGTAGGPPAGSAPAG